MWHDGWYGANWAVMGVFMVLFWGSLVAVAVWLISLMSRDKDASPQQIPPSSGATTPQALPDPGRAILDERLARGEISVEEYRSRLDALTKH